MCWGLIEMSVPWLVKQLGQPLLFPDIRRQWHWKSLQKAFPLTAIASSCTSLRLWILRLSVCMQRKFQLPILLYQNTILSASDVQLLLSVHITFSLSLSLSHLSFHFLPKALIHWPLCHSKNPLCGCCLCKLQYFMVD